MTGVVIPFPGMESPVPGVFGPEGVFARDLPGYQPRPGQVALAEAAHDVMARGGGLLAEAPCGVGKSLAYLVPAAYRAVRTGQKVVVATANIGLQEQLIQKDLPALVRTTGLPLRYALLKGRANYLCQHLARHGVGAGQGAGDLSAADRETLQAIDRWAQRTTTGDRAELPFAVTDGVWRLRSMDREDCLRDGCEWESQCFASRARATAEDAHLLVVNDHLLFAHIAVRIETGADVVLPKWDTLIVDEAHDAPDIARDFFGGTITPGLLRRIVRWMDREALDGGPLESASRSWWAATEKLLAPRLREGERALWLRGRPEEMPLALAAMALVDELEAVAVQAGTVAKRRSALAKELKAAEHPGARQELADARRAEATQRRARKAASWFGAVMCAADRDDLVLWLQASEGGHGGHAGHGGTLRYALEGRPLDVTELLRAHVWKHTRAVVMTSATLTTGEGTQGWDWIRRQLGTLDTTRLLSVPSPFDFARQALLVVTDSPDHRGDGPAFERHVAGTLRAVIEAARGRTLGLFTSRRLTQVTRQALADFGGPLLVQDDAPRAELLRRFREDPAAVLLGTRGLWTGVDVQGEACVGVVIDKLPFPPPSEPVIAALSARAKRRTGDEWAGFREEQLPRAVLQLRQGAGRLIRTVHDWGVVVICDGRLWSAKYGPSVVRSLGFPRVTRSLDEATGWLRERLEGEAVEA